MMKFEQFGAKCDELNFTRDRLNEIKEDYKFDCPLKLLNKSQ